jgi:hypothetical protein
VDKLTRRTDGLIVEYIGEEAVIYDERTHEAFCLNAATRAVWLLCDGGTRAEVVGKAKATLGIGADQASGMLVELERIGVLVCVSAPGFERVPGQYSRRLMMSRFASGAVMAVPFIAAIVAPPAALAYKGCTVKIGGICVLAQQAGSQAQVRRVRRRSSED